MFNDIFRKENFERFCRENNLIPMSPEAWQINNQKVVFVALDKYTSDAEYYKFSFLGFMSIQNYSEDEVESEFADTIFGQIPEMTEMWEFTINDTKPYGFDGRMNTYAVSFYATIEVKGNSEEHARDEFNEIINKFDGLRVEEVTLEE
jgi:hypothetical protein